MKIQYRALHQDHYQFYDKSECPVCFNFLTRNVIVHNTEWETYGEYHAIHKHCLQSCIQYNRVQCPECNSAFDPDSIINWKDKRIIEIKCFAKLLVHLVFSITSVTMESAMRSNLLMLVYGISIVASKLLFSFVGLDKVVSIVHMIAEPPLFFTAVLGSPSFALKKKQKTLSLSSERSQSELKIFNLNVEENNIYPVLGIVAFTCGLFACWSITGKGMEIINKVIHVKAFIISSIVDMEQAKQNLELQSLGWLAIEIGLGITLSAFGISRGSSKLHLWLSRRGYI